MMKRTTLLLVLFVILMQYSCRRVKDFTYLQKIADQEMISGRANKATDYKIRPMDNLYITIKTIDPEVNQLFSPSGQTGGYMTGTQQMYGDQVSQFINGYQVDTAGLVTLPILGQVSVTGLTLTQAKKRIQETSIEYLQDPVVDVKLLSFRINISGEVSAPGIYYHYQGDLNILDALSMANGVTDAADVKNIMVIRQNGNFKKTFILDLSQKEFFNSEGFYLYPYDMVYVNPGFNKKVDLNIQTYQLFLTTLTTLLGLQILYQPIRFE